MIEYTKTEKDGFQIFQISGDFIIGEIGDLLEDYTELIKEKKTKFIFDFTDVNLIDSSGLGTILMGASHIMSNNEKIRICINEQNKTVKELFSIVRLDSVMDYYSSIEDALKGTNKIKL